MPQLAANFATESFNVMDQMMRNALVAALVGFVVIGTAQAQQQRATPETRQQVQLSFAPVVQRVAPAVVNVYGARVERRTTHPLFDDPLFRQFFGDGGSGQRERMAQSVGSGVLVDPSGIVVTNHHVIEGMTELKVSLADRREFEAEIMLRDPRTDLAVLKLKNASNLSALELGNSDALEVGDLVLAIGNPFGVGQTVTQGIVSALARTQVGITDYQFFIQTDAAINPGNSGGALVDMAGRLIGINSAIYSKSGGSMGIGFAIPVNMVRVVVDSARSGGKAVRRPWVGARLQGVTAEIAEGLGLPRPEGVLVASVVAGGPSQKAGLKTGDLILAVDGQKVDDPEAFGYRIGTKPLGSQAVIRVMRGRGNVELTLPMAAAPETRPRDATLIQSRSPLGGATVANLSPALADELGIEATDGVAIMEASPGSPAQALGFVKGDVVVSINGQGVENAKGLEAAMRERQRYWRITINRGGRVFETMVGG